MAGQTSPRVILSYRILSEIFERDKRRDTDPLLHMTLCQDGSLTLLHMRRHAKLPIAAVKLNRVMK